MSESKRVHVGRSIVGRITGNQVNYLIALFIEAGINGDTQRLEWLEFEAGVNVRSFEEIASRDFNRVIGKLKEQI